MSDAKPVRGVIDDVLRQTAKRQRPLFAIQRRWTRLVGKRLAAHTRPVSLRRGRLIVHADQPGHNRHGSEPDDELVLLQRSQDGVVQLVALEKPAKLTDGF